MKKQKEFNHNFLSQFSNEVLSKGAEAVLPQNLSGKWLKRIQKMADEFLDENFEGKNCSEISDVTSPIFSACVAEIAKHKKGVDIQNSQELFVKYSTIYAISITMETMRRNAGLNFESPTLKNIFSDKRLHDLKKQYSHLGKFFQQVCLDSETDQ